MNRIERCARMAPFAQALWRVPGRARGRLWLLWGYGMALLVTGLAVRAGDAAASTRALGVVSTGKSPLGVDYGDRTSVHVLVIGINDYVDPEIPDLRCAVADATAVADVLRRYYGFTSVERLLNRDATRGAIMAKLREYWALKESDSLIVYFVGHGVMDEVENGFWVPADAKHGDLDTLVPTSGIFTECFAKYKVRHLLVVADSCFSGSAMELSRGGGDKDKVAGSLAERYRRKSRWLLTSANKEPTPDDNGSGHSPFTGRLLDYLRTADASGFGVQDLYVEVRKDQPTAVQAGPLKNSDTGAEFVFLKLDKPLEEEALSPRVARWLVEHELERDPAEAEVDGLLGLPRRLRHRTTGIRLALLPPGKFEMGTRDGNVVASRCGGAAEDYAPECPAHVVQISKPFYIGQYEVTNAQFRTLLPTHISPAICGEEMNGPEQPAVGMLYDRVLSFCEGARMRLPTEAEWEYACRAQRQAEKTLFTWGESPDAGKEHGNFHDQTLQAFKEKGCPDVLLGPTRPFPFSDGYVVTAPVGTFKPNAFGLYDMLGNAAEWCSDQYDPDFYKVAGDRDPFCDDPPLELGPCVRGGSWCSAPANARVCSRAWITRTADNRTTGFRVVKEIPSELLDSAAVRP